MLRNYLIVAFRNFVRHKLYSLVNVFGLAIGLTVCFLIYLFVQDELGYDRYHADAHRTFRIVDGEHAAIVAPFIPVVASEVPEIERATRIYPMNWSNPLLRFGRRAFYESRVFFVDSTFFDVLGYRLLSGNPSTALSRPFTVVFTESAARKYFGSVDPVGRVISYDNTHEFEVTGVVEDPYRQSHLQFDMLFSFATLYMLEEEWGLPLTWRNSSFYGYVRLATEDAGPEAAEKLGNVYRKHTDEVESLVRLQKVADIHLHPVAHDEFSARSDIIYVYLFGSMAIMVLLIACANFVNLTTARSSVRAREVGMRKALGADRMQLIRQFLGESILVSLLALGLSAVLIRVLLPTFNGIAGKDVAATEAFGGQEIGVMVLIALTTGLLAGLYPAVFLARLESAQVVKGELHLSMGRGLLRKSMVVAQFTMAVLLLAGMIIVAAQLDFMRNRDTGLTSDQIIVVPMADRSLIPRIEALEQEMLSHPNVMSVSTSHRVPGEGTNGFGLRRDGFEPISVREFGIDDDFLSTYEIELLAGRGFRDTGIDADGSTALINESAVGALGWADPQEAVGETVYVGDNPMTIVGVVENFNFRTLHHAIQPLLLNYYGFRMYLSLRIKGADIRDTIAHVEETWLSFSPAFPLSYFFLDQRMDAQYRAEERIDDLFRASAAFALLIGCMGLFGLSAFTAKRRTKEVGIRKAFGASVGHLVRLFSGEYLKLVGLAWLIAAPVVYFGADRWMDGFAFQADVGVWPYLLAGLITLMIAWLTVSYQSVRSALADPVEALRYE